MKTKTVFKFFILLAILSTNCKKKEENCNTIYFDTIGIGYVFKIDSTGFLQHVQGANVTLKSYNGHTGFWIQTAVIGSVKNYITDINGCYQVRFVKSACVREEYGDGNRNVLTDAYSFECENKSFSLPVEKVRFAKGTILLDTLFIR
jgi:hypothetical protein